jgi:dihydrofolate synthase/folylpolyglutamate synthase
MGPRRDRSSSSSSPGRAYERALARLLAQPTLPKLGLLRMRALCAQLGDPQHAVPTLHIAGTKGKGSTAAMAASILREAGLHTGLTTSPHLLSARERIVIDGAMVDEAAFARLEARVHAAAGRLDPGLEVPSFFERTVAMALLAFADAAVDVAVVEVGLGGRLDATNVVVPRATAVTRLGLDHMEFLGDTLAAIAGEKAGILKAGVPAVTIAQADEAHRVLAATAAAVGAPLTVVPIDDALAPSLHGAHQRENASLARALVRAGGFAVDDAVVDRGLRRVVWPARYETLSTSPLVIVDGAHNADAARALRATLASDARVGARHVVLGVSRGHDPRELADLLLPGARSIVATQAQHVRALSARDIARAAAAHGVVDVEPSVAAAIAVACARARRDGGVVVVTGSLFVAGEARACFLPMPRDPVRPAF